MFFNKDGSKTPRWAFFQVRWACCALTVISLYNCAADEWMICPSEPGQDNLVGNIVHSFKKYYSPSSSHGLETMTCSSFQRGVRCGSCPQDAHWCERQIHTGYRGINECLIRGVSPPSNLMFGKGSLVSLNTDLFPSLWTKQALSSLSDFEFLVSLRMPVWLAPSPNPKVNSPRSFPWLL